MAEPEPPTETGFRGVEEPSRAFKRGVRDILDLLGLAWTWILWGLLLVLLLVFHLGDFLGVRSVGVGSRSRERC